MYLFKDRTASVDDVASLGSFPDITLNADVISSKFFDNIPMVSKDDAWATKPYLEILPYVGLRPYIPQNAAGCLIDPPVSDPNAISHKSSATAAADPPLDPPATFVKS